MEPKNDGGPGRIAAWLGSGEYLPQPLRDFHDQKNRTGARTMSAFTKGPWLLGNESDACCDVVIGETVASFDRQSPYTGKYVISREEMLANAHLTIAAPDMYEALRAVIADYGIRCGPDDALRPIGAQPMSLRLVMAALAKAVQK